MRRTLFLSESLVFPKLQKGIPVVRVHEQDSRKEAVILQNVNPFSGEVSALLKNHEFDLCVVCYPCDYPVKFLDDIAKAGLKSQQVVLIVCPHAAQSKGRVITPKELDLCLRVDGLCNDKGAGVLRAAFEFWLARGMIDFEKLSTTG